MSFKLSAYYSEFLYFEFGKSSSQEETASVVLLPCLLAGRLAVTKFD